MHYVELPSFSYFVAGAWRRRILVLGAGLVGLALAACAYISIRPTYEPTTTLLVMQRQGADGKEESARASESPATLAQIAVSPIVVKAAVERVGSEAMGFGETGRGTQFYGWLRSLLRAPRTQASVENENPLDREDVVAAILARSISVRTETNSDILKLAFRHPDPQIATRFVDALAAALIDRQAALLERPGALRFFQTQKDRFDSEFLAASKKLESMAVSKGIYSLEDQRSLLLKRQSEIESAMSNSRSALEEKSGQRDGLVRQLKLLKPVTSSSYVSGLVDYLASAEGEAAPANANAARGKLPIPNASDPPLLLVKVYQDNLVSLFRLNSEIAGLTVSQTQQEEEARQIAKRLEDLTRQQAEFEKLKREVSLATYNAEVYAKRAVDEQIDRELRAAKFSQLRILQPAVYPLAPVFPRLSIFAVAGLFLGVATALVFFAIVDFRAWVRVNPEPKYANAAEADDFSAARARAALLRAIGGIRSIDGRS